MLDDLETVHKENEFNANHDALTGLPNRRLLQELMTHSLHQSQRSGSKLALLFLDLDDFKIINDTKGHDFGDDVLNSVAFRLSECLRKSDILARIGGDEFIVLLENIENADQVKTAAEKILNCFKEVFTIKGHDFTISTSIGISLYPEDGKDAQTLIKKADLALYQTKVVGKSHYAFYSTIASEKDSDSQT
jgi:diguanylate cyclase (GGDEF)-like protein